MSADTGLRGLDLLDAAIDHIEAHPEEWNQLKWRCASGMCLAGHVASLAGASWPYAGDDSRSIYIGSLLHERSELVTAQPEDDSRYVCDVDGVQVIPVLHQAERLLGFRSELAWTLDDSDETRDLFEGYNDLAEIKAMRDDLRAHLRGAS